MIKKVIPFIILILVVGCSPVTMPKSKDWSLANVSNKGWLTVSDASTIFGAVKTEDFFWVASEGGLLRYSLDGRDLVQYLPPDCDIAGVELQAIELLKDKLVMTSFLGVTIYDIVDDTWENFLYEDFSLSSSLVQNIEIINDEIWITASGGILIFRSDSSWDIIVPDNVYGTAVEFWDIFQDTEGSIHLLGVDSNKKISRSTTAIHLVEIMGSWQQTDDSYIHPYSFDHVIYKNNFDRGGIEFSEDNGITWEVFYRNSPYTKLLDIDNQGNLYIATLDGLLILDTDKEVVNKYFYDDYGPDLDSIEFIDCDGSGNCVFSSSKSWNIFNKSEWINENLEPLHIGILNQGYFYFMRKSDLFSNEMEYSTIEDIGLSPLKMTFNDNIISITKSGEVVFVQTENNEITIVKEDNKIVEFKSPIESDWGNKIIFSYQASNGKCWFVTQKLDIFTFYEQYASLIDIPEINFEQFRTDKIWVKGINNELIIANENMEIFYIDLNNGQTKFEQLSLPNSIDKIFDVDVLSDGTLIIATGSELIKVGDTFQYCIGNSEMGLSSVLYVYVDKNDQIWVSDTFGVSTNFSDLQFHLCEE